MEGVHPGRQKRRIRHLIPGSTADPPKRAPGVSVGGPFSVRATCRTRSIPACAGPTDQLRRQRAKAGLVHGHRESGSIPACAGPTIQRLAVPAKLSVGPSPRARGRLGHDVQPADCRAGSIPACAGPTRVAQRLTARARRSIPACAGPTLVDLGVYSANEWFSLSLAQGRRRVFLCLFGVVLTARSEHDGPGIHHADGGAEGPDQGTGSPPRGRSHSVHR